MIISIDIGNGFIKALNSKNNYLHFPSIVKKQIAKVTSFSAMEKYIVYLDNNYYYVGESAITKKGRRSWSNTKMNEFTDIFIATCLNLLSEDSKNIDLCLGLPYSYYVEQNDGQYLIDEYTNKTIDCTVNGIQKKINISSVTVIPQGGGAFYSNILSNNNTNDLNSYFIDIGYRTVDCVEFIFSNNNLSLNHETSFSLEENGTYEIFNNILKFVSAEVGKHWNVIEIENAILHNNYILIYNSIEKYDIHQIAETLFEDSANEIFSEILFNVPRITKIENIYLSGGGAKFLYPYFKNLLPNIKLQKNSIFANADGYLQLSKINKK